MSLKNRDSKVPQNMLAHHKIVLPPKNGKMMNTIPGISLSSISFPVLGMGGLLEVTVPLLMVTKPGSIRAYSVSMQARDHNYSISEHQYTLIHI
jgi:hypothetical protein